MHERSLLFVPGNRPDRFEKACQSDADLVCIDLEDAVGQNDKKQARNTVIAWLQDTSHTHVSLRINALDTPFALDDIRALKESGLDLPFLMIPKVGTAEEITVLQSELPEALGPFFVIIESAKGLLNAEGILAATRVTYALYGAIDYAGDVGCDLAWETHLYPRSKLAAIAACFDVTLFDVPHIDVRNLDDCEDTTRAAKALGIFARSAIHPAQIARIHAALSPSVDEVIWAKRVLAANAESGGNVTLLDGQFIEAPIVKKAKRIVAFEKSD